jgi:Cytochrome c554 and c-prime
MGDDLPSAGSRGGRQLGKMVFLIAVILMAVVVIAQYWPWGREAERGPDSRSSSALTSSAGSGAKRTAKYVGPASCGECHPGESALQRRSGHDRTLGLAERSHVIEWLNGKSEDDPKYPDVKWSYRLRDSRLVVDRTLGGRTESLALDYAVGSGKHGVTFVAIQEGKTKSDPQGIEHRLSYLADSPRLDVTPGQEGSQRDPHDRVAAEQVGFGRAMGVDHLRRCFACHSTVTSTATPGLLETANLLPNISCERCHGPAGDHVERARRGETDLTMPMGQDPVQPWVEVNLCGECHRVPRLVSESSIKADNPGIVRFQGVGISMSACYVKGEGNLRCTTCHDPHDRASSDHSHYEAACLTCHRSAQAQKACPISPAANCVGCHMPRREVRGNGVFTDHWIRKPTSTRGGPPKSEAARSFSMLR